MLYIFPVRRVCVAVVALVRFLRGTFICLSGGPALAGYSQTFRSDRRVAVRSILVAFLLFFFVVFNSSDSLFILKGNNGRSTLADLHIKSDE